MHYAQFAGHFAHDAYTYLDHPKVHISRIDLQVTVQYSEELLKEGRYQYARAIHYNKALPESRQRKIHLFAGSDGGDTVYVGSPSSDTRGRIYNKDKQSRERAFERSWRYEAVYRNQSADRVYRCVVSSDTALASIIVPTVVEFFRQRGVNILGLGGVTGNVIEMAKPTPSDVERKLRWIRNQVVPTIRKLAEMGYAEELMEVIAEAVAAARNSQL
jgi:DNA relaxase NicK